MTCDFQQHGIVTSVDSDEPVQPPFKLRNSKSCSVSSLRVIEYSSDKQRLWSDCTYVQAGLSLCWSHNHIVGNLMSPLFFCITVKVLKFQTLFFLFSNKILVFSTGIHKMHVRIANREDPDQTASSEAVWSEYALFVYTFYVSNKCLEF